MPMAHKECTSVSRGAVSRDERFVCQNCDKAYLMKIKLIDPLPIIMLKCLTVDKLCV